MQNNNTGRSNSDNNAIRAQQTIRAQMIRDRFAEEAISYLLSCVGIQRLIDPVFLYFSESMGQAILTISYVYRRRLWTLFENSMVDFSHANQFEKFAQLFEVVRDECYFYRFLVRISHVFELTLYCLKKGHRYIDHAIQIVATDDNILFFETNGGFSRLMDTADFISQAGELLQDVISEEEPGDTDFLSPFLKVLERIENPCYGSPIRHKALLENIKRYVLCEVGDIRIVDPRIIKIFYAIMWHPPSRVYSMNQKQVIKRGSEVPETIDIENEKKMIFVAFRTMLAVILGEMGDDSPHTAEDLAQRFAIMRHLTDLVASEIVKVDFKVNLLNHELKSRLDTFTSNAYFILADDYIAARESGNLKSRKKDLAACESISTKMARSALNCNIDKKNYFKLSNGSHVVYTDDCSYDYNSTIIIVSLE